MAAARDPTIRSTSYGGPPIPLLRKELVGDGAPL